MVNDGRWPFAVTCLAVPEVNTQGASLSCGDVVQQCEWGLFFVPISLALENALVIPDRWCNLGSWFLVIQRTPGPEFCFYIVCVWWWNMEGTAESLGILLMIYIYTIWLSWLRVEIHPTSPCVDGYAENLNWHCCLPFWWCQVCIYLVNPYHMFIQNWDEISHVFSQMI